MGLLVGASPFVLACALRAPATPLHVDGHPMFYTSQGEDFNMGNAERDEPILGKNTAARQENYMEVIRSRESDLVWCRVFGGGTPHNQRGK